MTAKNAANREEAVGRTDEVNSQQDLSPEAAYKAIFLFKHSNAEIKCRKGRNENIPQDSGFLKSLNRHGIFLLSIRSESHHFFSRRD